MSPMQEVTFFKAVNGDFHEFENVNFFMMLLKYMSCINHLYFYTIQSRSFFIHFNLSSIDL